MQKKKQVSIVVPAYNEEKGIHQCLDSLCKLKTHRAFEVIVVDNASTDKTQEVVRRYMKKLPLRIVKETKKGRGVARFRGFAEAKGTYIFSTDADAAVPSDWVDTMVELMEQKQAIAITGYGQMPDHHWLTNQLINIILHPLSLELLRILFGYYWLTGYNFAVKADAYRQSGGFDKHLNANEDADLSRKLHTLGKIVLTPRVRVHVSGRRFQKGIVYGCWEYTRIFFAYMWYRWKGGQVNLSDIR